MPALLKALEGEDDVRLAYVIVESLGRLRAAEAIRRWQADSIVVLPLYPQFSTTTSGSSLQNWQTATQTAKLAKPQARICCYPWLEGFLAAEAALNGRAIDEAVARHVAEAAFAGAQTRGDNDYKPELGKRTLVRALMQAAQLSV